MICKSGDRDGEMEFGPSSIKLSLESLKSRKLRAEVIE